jgi:hypothetical protein
MSYKHSVDCKKAANTPTVTAVLAVEHPSGMNSELYDILMPALQKLCFHLNIQDLQSSGYAS